MLSLILMFTTACTQQEVDIEVETATEISNNNASNELLLSTTTSTENSGLLDYILPVFKEDTGIEVKVVAVGTGAALQNGRDGNADVLMVHAKDAEEEFVADGHGIERFDLMYNDFVLLGPSDDPAAIKTKASQNILDAFSFIHDQEATFISRGDNSGTHMMEVNLWKEADLEPNGKWYLEAGQGMGAVIEMADNMLGYTLSDRATYLSMMSNLDLIVVTEGDERLFNQYGIIAVDPNKNNQINHAAAEIFIEWMLSEKGQGLIGEFGIDTFGEPLFIPNAK
ncbi:MAG: substrate-binding domain-containing protein [Clostridiaceae bacterium]|nr:substrate-binding domain-containing protein [Clostridiaceae bacterium]